MQGKITPLSELRPMNTLYNVHVRVSRTWKYRGKSEKNPLIHFDMVVIDQKGYAMYYEVPPQVVDQFKQYFQEGKVLYICNACVERAKPGYRVVDGPYILKLIMRTQIFEGNSNDTNFPKYVFSLTPIEMLPQYARRTDRFLDVIGKIIAISNAAVVRNTSGDLMMRRLITLQDHKGNTIDLSLSGQRALEFDAEAVFHIGQNHHVIAIFVGTLMKIYREDYKFLSGTSACRWYINENDIPAMRTFQRGLPSQVTPIKKLELQSEDYMEQGVEEKTLFDLKQIDPLTDKNKRFQCTVTLISIPEKEQWCYRACRVCNSRMIPGDDGYQCTKIDGCSCKQYDWKYKVCFRGADDTHSLEFMFFEKKGVELIGKSAETLRKQHDPSSIPPEISQWISHKFTFIVKVLFKRSVRNMDPSFEVVMIKQRHGKQATLPNIIQSVSNDDLPPLVTISSKQKTDQQSLSYTPQFTDIQDMDVDQQSDAWDTTENHSKSQINDNDDKKHEEQKRKKLKIEG